MDAPIHIETMDELLATMEAELTSLVSLRQSPATKWFPGKSLPRSSRSMSTRWTSHSRPSA